jgi:thiol-disulfide isomerase/thioredoxin
LLALATLSTSSAGPFTESKFADACTAATNDDKIVLIDFYTTWCGPCKLLDQKTWKDPEVIKLLESKTVSLKIDAEKETELADRSCVQSSIPRNTHASFTCGKALIWKNKHDFLKI